MQSEKGGYIFEDLGCTVSDEESEQAERELKLLLFEKGLLEDILSSIQDAGSIDPSDRERIYRKYDDQLRSIEERIGRCRLVVKLRKLELGRMKLLDMLRDRLENLDREIMEIRSTLGKQRRESRTKPEVVESKQARSRVAEARGVKQVEVVEDLGERDELQKLQEDIMATLEKLEQLDLEL
ncbi:MAG: hypothetical protein QW374_02000 [Candidatus Bathyarchaeia archaeon]|nr:hypothetical protein [Candidatus Bathyarchaeota archaeon]